MRQNDAFSGLHPTVNFIYFLLVIGCGMAFTHPVCTLISLVCALCYCGILGEKPLFGFWLLPLFVLTALINPLVSHEGVTVLRYLPSGNPLTLESICYGLHTAALTLCIIVWFSCFNAVMTTDKITYLFGRILPSLSLVLTMALRFVPRFAKQLRRIADAQKQIGCDTRSDSVLQRIRSGVRLVSVLITWSLENAAETADSMKSRGYGLPRRTFYCLCRFTRRDRNTLIWLLICGAGVIASHLLGFMHWQFYPMMKGASPEVWTVCSFILYFALCITPTALGWKEEAAWKHMNFAA